MLILISSVVSAGHTLTLRDGSESDLSRRNTSLDAITPGEVGLSWGL
ncbi:MAG TPA: hypothetical protein VGU64_00810 [Terriglobales bacterium]|nr:hypothetical protein [Terriglobales bacterium]